MFNFIFKEDHDRVRASMKAVLVEVAHYRMVVSFVASVSKIVASFSSVTTVTAESCAHATGFDAAAL